MEILLIGGTGFIGQAVSHFFQEKGVPVIVLTRNPSETHHRFWDPIHKEGAYDSLENITHIINVNGAGIAEKRWTKKRKHVLRASRVEATEYLYKVTKEHCPNLRHYLGISGINAFGFSDHKVFHEEDPMGTDYLSCLVSSWEKAHQLFKKRVPTTIIRLGMVIDPRGGAYEKMANPIRLGFGAVVGNGHQKVPWISLSDVVGLLHHLCVDPNPSPTLIHGVSNHSTMHDITHFIARQEEKKIRLPNIPSFVIYLLFGRMGQLLTRSLQVHTESLIATGYPIKNPTLSSIPHAKKD
jgi:uncharacterized protein (TIGR01777 family)